MFVKTTSPGVPVDAAVTPATHCANNCVEKSIELNVKMKVFIMLKN